MNRWIAAAVCGAVLAGCGASGGNTQIIVDDAGTTPTDTGSTTVDTGSTARDTGTTTSTDRGTTTATDRGTTTSTDAGGGSYGICGQSFHAAICACGQTDQACQTTALQNALMNSTCATCYQQGITGCCPTQVMAVQTCAQAAGCMDAACAQRMCATQYTALQTCYQNGVQNDATCQGYVQRCFGPTFPQVDCSM